MSKGFQSNEDTDAIKIAIGVKRLTPSAKRGDIHAFSDGCAELQRRYGHQVADEAMRQVMEQIPGICDLAMNAVEKAPPAMKAEFYAKSIEVMAEVLTDAGLRLEDHLRVNDEGIGLTKQAVATIAATGYPGIKEFGEGNDSLEEMGLNRTNGFVHPLSEAIKPTKENGLPEDVLNLWAVVSMIISGAQGWTEADKDKCLEMLKELVSRSAPTADLNALLYRSRYDDRVLLKLCSLAHTAMEAKAVRAFE